MQVVKVKRITPVGRGKAYNISMQNNHNFLLANGVLTHNTVDAQFSLRNIFETYSKDTRFILTANYLNKIIEPLRSRCQLIEFQNMGRKNIKVVLERILTNEGIKYNIDDLLVLIDTYYPDIRSMINCLQLHSLNGEWKLKNLDSFRNLEQLLAHLKTGDLKAISELNIDYIEAYRYLFDKVDDLTSDYSLRVDLSDIIAEYLYRDTFIADKSINFRACCLKVIQKLK